MNKEEYFGKLEKIANSVSEAQDIATEFGIYNLSQPGIIKEIITAFILKHRIHQTKNEHDAEEFDNPDIRYEYLSCIEGKSFQFDRIDETNAYHRIVERKSAIYCSVFDKDSPLTLKLVYKILPLNFYNVYKKRTNNSKHISIPEKVIQDLVSKNSAEIVYKKL